MELPIQFAYFKNGLKVPKSSCIYKTENANDKHRNSGKNEES